MHEQLKMLFSPEERRRVRKILLRKIEVSEKELEALVDGLLNLAVELNKICGKHHARRAKWCPPQDK